jgi:hypothetical protein
MLRVVRSDDRRSWGILAGRFRRRVDPNGVRQDFEARRALHEALGMRGVGGQACAMTGPDDRGRAPVVDIGRRQIAQTAVMMRIVVPREEIVADAATVRDRAEPIRKLWPVFERPKLSFGKRIVVLTRGRE